MPVILRSATARRGRSLAADGRQGMSAEPTFVSETDSLLLLRRGEENGNGERMGIANRPQAKANLEQIDAASSLIFARLMNLATPEEREALNLLMAEARTSVLYLEEAHKLGQGSAKPA
jgi:hypothetical protein